MVMSRESGDFLDALLQSSTLARNLRPFALIVKWLEMVTKSRNGDKSLEVLLLLAVLDLQLNLVDEISRKVGDDYPVTELQR